MSPVKERVLGWIQDLPDESSLDDILYHLYVRKSVEAGLRDMAEGNVVSDDEVWREMDEWLLSNGVEVPKDS